ncbi:MAG: hypothetical protein AB1806_16795 [Acidobacteriota bacterium]
MTRSCPGPAAALPALVAVVLVGLSARGAPVRGLTGGEHLARLYGLALDADFASAEAALARSCAPAPQVACDVVGLGVLWWRIYLDAANRRFDRPFLDRAAGIIAAADAWTRREPDRAEAWFYLGAAYGARVQLRAERREYFAAARDGKRIMQALDRARALDPDLHDANFGSGLYKYYADVAPRILKFLRWLLALPGGNRAEGLRQMQRTRSQGVLLRDDANYQLQQIYLWYEKQPDLALALLEELRQRHPRNPLFLADIARLHDLYRRDRRASLAAYQELAGLAASGAVNEATLGATLGRLGAAGQLQALGRIDDAMHELQVAIDARPAAPYGALANAHLALARLQARGGQIDRARESLRAAIAAAPPDDPHEVGKQARDELSRLR